MEILQLIIAAFGGGALFSFIQFLITRRDNSIKKAIAALDAKIEENYAKTARRCILRYSQEVRAGIRHTKEEWDQINTDIDDYNHYCKTHPEFENSRAVLAIEMLQGIYKNCLMHNDFDLDRREVQENENE